MILDKRRRWMPEECKWKSKASEISLENLTKLLDLMTKDFSDPSLIISLRADGSGAIESNATKTIYAVWLDAWELEKIIKARMEWAET